VIEHLQIAATDGRRLDVELAGPEDGRALIMHVGTPSAGLLFEPHVQAGAQRGVLHIAYSRPGYASSERHQGRTVASCAADVTTIAEALGIERLLTVGWSGGGPHALACAALLPEKTLAAATMAGAAPFAAADLDFLDGMGEENIEEFAAAQAGEAQLLAYLQAHGTELAASTGQEIHGVLSDLLSEVDRLALSGAFAEHLARCMRVGLEHGMWGWLDDDLAFIADWGFDLAAITAPVSVWHGAQDRFVPFAHGQWLADHVAGARAHLLPDDGHLSVCIGAYGAVLDELIANSGLV
jgi:pimeloyl-ACP methyl ester carboxylesterase